MLYHSSDKSKRVIESLNRRDFLRAGALGAGALTLGLTGAARSDAASSPPDRNCILLFLVGGPSHIDTFDPKPNAPENIRGPFRPIRTCVPGLDLCEHLPELAKQADKFALVRSVHHTAAPIHETGQQLMQTGRLFRDRVEYPHYGSALAYVRGKKDCPPPFMVLPWPIRETGVNVSHGQTAGFLGDEFGPRFFSASISKPTPSMQLEGYGEHQRYGWNPFGRSVLWARRLVEAGVRFVTVNMFDTVFNKITWDCHADGGSLSTTLNDYAETLCPTFDRACSALLEDLHERGMLSNTLVLAMGEFGRTPKINPRGGRDHWTGAWSILLAGAGIRGGQLVGSSDKIGAEVRDRPVTPAEIAATVYHALEIRTDTRIPGPNGESISLCDAKPISELF
ncbi:MAG TPA: DUF1501 domain-containing protein [Gemmataceae bacterium]|nr:DUF1501 domain-containing protein [Gemmataceae bacterium]